MYQTLRLLSVFFAFIFFTSCSDEPSPENLQTEISESFNDYIAAYTSGTITKKSTIVIELKKPIDPNALNWEGIKEDLFDFTPNITGTVLLQDSRTIVFKPSEHFISGQAYSINFNINKIFPEASSLGDMSYDILVRPQNVELHSFGLSPMDENNPKFQQLNGQVVFSDIATLEEAKKVLRVTDYDGNELDINWLTKGDDLTVYEFQTENIERKENSTALYVELDGESIDLPKAKEKNRLEIPALNEFKLMSSRVITENGLHLVLQFSDPLAPNQDLTGLIDIQNVTQKRLVVDGSEIKIYVEGKISGGRTVTIHPGVKNKYGFSLKTQVETNVIFAQEKPNVRFVGKGSILPSSQGLILPFEAVSLSSVNVQITRIFEDNVLQFLQNNDFDGDYELRRVGKVVLQKVVYLNPSNDLGLNLNKWNRYTLNLDELINAEPGAIYRVEMGFKKEQTIYTCFNEDENTLDPTDPNYWDNFNNYYHDYSDYDYQLRKDPCASSYYGNRRNITKNIFATDIGLLAKKSESGEILIVANDILTTKPIEELTIELYDYSQQKIASGTTNGNGVATFNTEEEAYFAIAKRQQERSFIKLNDGNSLSLSNFDVGGEKIQKGIKGFIYGERGVWRPGDSLFFSFILENKSNQTLDQPVIFELRDPQGQLKSREVVKNGVHGFYPFITTTDENDITGRWNLKVIAAGRHFYKTVKIEAIKPNRLKVDLDFGKEYLTSDDQFNLTGTLNVKWMHGATGANLKAEYDLQLKESTAKFENYNQYTFDNPSVDFYSKTQKVFEGKTNQEGQATITSSFELPEKKPTLLKAVFEGKVYEPGGNFSIDYNSIPYYPYESMMGINVVSESNQSRFLETDTAHQINIVCLNPEGKKVDRNQAVVTLYKLNWRWWWDYSSGRSNYIQQYEKTFKSRKKVQLNNGSGTYQLKVNYPSWGRFLVEVHDPVSGHTSGKVIWIDWPYWRGQSNKGGQSGATLLQLAADKESYSVGEQVTLNIPSSEGGRAFVSLESGSRVLKTFWVDTEKENTKATFQITEGMAPNIYAHVTLLQPHMQTANDLPIRMYGLTRIKVDDPNTRLSPVIEQPKTLEPEQTVRLKIKEENGKAMTFTVAVVDEGLLDLTNYTTPNPWDNFYATEALGVKTYDIYDYVMGAFSGNLQRLLALGGDESGKGKKNAKARRFKPVVKYFGPFHLEAGEEKSIQYKMPNYIGSVKTMVVAGENGAYGSGESVTPVKQSLMVLGTLPRFLSPNTTIDLPVNVFVNDDKITSADIKLNIDDKLTVVGKTSRVVTFNGKGEQTIYFRVKVKSLLGATNIKIIGSAAGKTSRFESDLEIRSPNPIITEVSQKLLPSGEKWKSESKPFGLKGTNKLVVESSSLPSVNLEKRLSYLTSYPHGCIEQTTSGAFPQLYLKDILKLTSGKQQQIKHNVEGGIKRLYLFKQSNGGLGYWPGANSSNSWGSTYAAHFLTEASKKGYYVETVFLNDLYHYLATEAKEFDGNRNYQFMRQAYRLFVLALAGKPEYGAMNRLAETPNLNISVYQRLAGAYAIIGRKEMATKLMTQTINNVKKTREWYWYTYGSTSRDQAMLLETQIYLGNETESFKLLEEVAANLSSNSWYSTQATAYGLIAYSLYVSKFAKGDSEQLTLNYNNSGAKDYVSESPINRMDFDPEKQSINTFEFVNTGTKPLFVRVYTSGVPNKVVETSSFSKLKMTIVYTDMAGNPIDPKKLKQGTEFSCKVTVTNPGLDGNYQNLAFTQMIPAGWEIRNERLNGDAPTQENIDYLDIRDDRISAYFNLKANRSVSITFDLHASFSGNYFLPPALCSEMYDDDINARIGGKAIEVFK